jgi:hypothetical protein
MENNTLEIVSLVISGFALLVSFINIYYSYTRISQNKQSMNDLRNKNGHDFAMQFKDDLNEFRLQITEILITKDQIQNETKANVLYVLDDKYDKAFFDKYFNEEIYKNFMNLKLNFDDSLNEIVYQNDFNALKSSLSEIKYFYSDFNRIFNTIYSSEN